MPQKIESAGVYIGTITESGISLTKNNFPQVVLRLEAKKKFIEEKSEIEFFQKQGLLQEGQPAYVDWSSFGEEGMYFGVLFKSATEFSKDTALLNYDQLQLATGWDGTEFDSFTDGSFVGTDILFRVQEKKAYINKDGKQVGGDGSLEISWIDNKDAPPQRQLKSVEADQVKALNAMLKGMGTKIAKPAASAPSKPAVTKPTVVAPAVKPPPAPTPTVTVGSAAGPSSPTVPAESAPSAPAAESPKPPSKKKAKAVEPAPAPTSVATETPAAPAETNQTDAWAFVCANKGANEDQVVEEAWIDACAEVGSDKEETDFTGTDWAKVRDIVLKDLAA